jgi:nitrite reductase/ring-hydroxylating ferredoxin subunit
MVQVGPHRVGVFSDGERYHALLDRCPHRGAPLCSHGEVVTPIVLQDGKVDLGRPNSVVRCPWHKWDFDIVTGRCLVDAKLRIRRCSVHRDDDQLVVRLVQPSDSIDDR